MKSLFRAIKVFIRRFLRRFLSDKAYISAVYFLTFGRPCNLRNPKRWTEKVQWKKLYDRRDLLTLAADKYRVRRYVKEKVGEHILTKVYWVGEKPEEIPFDSLPDSFVIKTNHGCGTNIIVKDKSRIEKESIILQLKKWLETDYYAIEKEWAYKDIGRVVYLEEFLAGREKEVPEDYKFYFLNGVCQMVDIHLERFSNHKTLRLTPELRTFDFLEKRDIPKSRENVEYFVAFDKPKQFENAFEIAQKLALEFDFIRVDLYILEERIVFGELTNYPTGGWKRLPVSLDFYLGQNWDLPEKEAIRGMSI